MGPGAAPWPGSIFQPGLLSRGDKGQGLLPSVTTGAGGALQGSSLTLSFESVRILLDNSLSLVSVKWRLPNTALCGDRQNRTPARKLGEVPELGRHTTVRGHCWEAEASFGA